jgi:hypothetical protein
MVTSRSGWVRVLRAGKTRSTRGHAVWVSDVFAWRGSPAAWNEDLLHVTGARIGAFEPEELKRLHRLGDNPIVATLTPDVGELVAWRWRPNTAQLCLARTARRLAEADPPNLLSELPAAGASGANYLDISSYRSAERPSNQVAARHEPLSLLPDDPPPSASRCPLASLVTHVAATRVASAVQPQELIPAGGVEEVYGADTGVDQSEHEGRDVEFFLGMSLAPGVGALAHCGCVRSLVLAMRVVNMGALPPRKPPFLVPPCVASPFALAGTQRRGSEASSRVRRTGRARRSVTCLTRCRCQIVRSGAGS